MIARSRVRIRAGAAGDVSSAELTLYADSYSMSVPPQCYRSGTQKDPSHSAKSSSGKLHLNTHTPLTQPSRSGLIMPPSRHSLEIYPETSSHATCQGAFGQLSQLAEPLRTDSGMKSGINVRELISTSKQKQKEEEEEEA